MTHRAPRLLAALAVSGLLVAGCADEGAPIVEDTDERVEAIVHMSPTCDCCGAHAAHLDAAGYDVTLVEVEDVREIKEKVGLPGGLESCHTTLIDGYAVEGHVPAASIDRLLTARPAIDGIALAGMPAGSPGMGGTQQEPWHIESFVDGHVGPRFDTR